MVYNKLDCFVSALLMVRIILNGVFIEIRNIYFDRYYETVISFPSILGEYLNSVKLDYMSC